MSHFCERALTKSAALQLCLSALQSKLRPSLEHVSVGQAPKPRILYWKPELPYAATLYNAFQMNKRAVMVRLYK